MDALSLFSRTPSAPRDVTPVIVSTRFVTLSWGAPADAANADASGAGAADAVLGYSVYYKQTGSDR